MDQLVRTSNNLPFDRVRSARNASSHCLRAEPHLDIMRHSMHEG